MPRQVPLFFIRSLFLFLCAFNCVSNMFFQLDFFPCRLWWWPQHYTKMGLSGGGGGGCLCLCRLVMTTVLRQGGGCLCVSVQTLVTTTVSYKDRLVMVCVSVRADSGDDHSIKTGWWWSVSVQTLVTTTVLRQGGGGLCPCRLWWRPQY